MIGSNLLNLLPAFCALIGFVAASDLRTEKNAFIIKPVGEPHGTPYDDFSNIGSAHGLHRRIAAISMACAENEHVYAISVVYWDPLNPKVSNTVVTHGPMPDITHKDHHRYDLAKDEYIVSMDIKTWKAKVGSTRRTRLGYLTMRTNKSGHLSCGVYSSTDLGLYQEPKDSALLYLSGTAGNALDSMTAHWIPKADH